MPGHKTVFTTERGQRHQQAALDAAPKNLAITMLRQPDRETLLSHLSTAEYFISERTGVVDAEMIQSAPHLKLILRLGSLTYDIDVEAAKEAGVAVCYWPVASVIRVAEHLVMQMLALSKNLRQTEAIALEAVKTVQGRTEACGVQVEIMPRLPAIYGDRARLVEVVQNLVDNACKFMGEQPHPKIEIGARQDGDETVFYVRDNGIGIDPQYHEKVFGLFDKLDPQSEGTGIGLALVKRIVETHDGRIWVESEGAGKGSTFYFTLPNEHQ